MVAITQTGVCVAPRRPGPHQPRWCLRRLCLSICLAIICAFIANEPRMTQAGPAAKQKIPDANEETREGVDQAPVKVSKSPTAGRKSETDDTSGVTNGSGSAGEDVRSSKRGDRKNAKRDRLPKDKGPLTEKETSEEGKATGGEIEEEASGDATVDSKDTDDAKDKGRKRRKIREFLNRSAVESFFSKDKIIPSTRTLVASAEKKFRKWLQSRSNKKENKSCDKAKEKGVTPSAELGHSPLKAFGYPMFDEDSGYTILQARIPLSTVSGFPAPIHVGGEDYYVQGSYDEIIQFLECFEDYEVIASSLLADGHWTKDPGHGSLYIQLQNTREGVRSPVESTKYAMFRGGLSSVKKILRVAAALNGYYPQDYEKLTQVFRQVSHIAEFFPNTSSKDLLSMWTEISQITDSKQQLSYLISKIREALARRRVDGALGWQDAETVDLSAPLTMMFTSYPRPSHGVRATFEFESNRATLKEIRETLPEIFNQSLVGKAMQNIPRTTG